MHDLFAVFRILRNTVYDTRAYGKIKGITCMFYPLCGIRESFPVLNNVIFMRIR